MSLSSEYTKWTNSGYISLSRFKIPSVGDTNFDGYNIHSDIIVYINNYINKGMPESQKKPNSAIFFYGSNEYSIININGWDHGTVTYYNDNNSLMFVDSGITEDAAGANIFYVLTR